VHLPSDSDIKIKTISELVLPSSEIVLEKGQQNVDNGIPINGQWYNLFNRHNI